MEATLKRVYVGGIGPSVTRAELIERFGKFGKVDDVDIISRKDEQGNPTKTFAYLNINISEAELKKCISVLNRTKWKGGVLQIEMAKESFLHKLEQERQQTKEKEKAKEQKMLHRDLVQSLAKSGVTDFQMKAAVPGTEVPNHKNWVVSKFGRVLPVLHLNGSKQSKMSGSKQSKIMKYDPSKFCHNIKKLEDDFQPVSISQLTWKLEGGDDEVSRKRRGEFPDFKISPKKKPVSLNKSDTDNTKMTIGTSSSVQTTAVKNKNNTTRKPVQTNNQRHLQNKSINSMSDVEYDSEEELQAILLRETSRASVNDAEDSNVEVVDDSFELSYTTHWAEQTKRKSTCSSYDDYEYDSADTDEIITVAKTAQNHCDNSKNTKDKTVRNYNATPLKFQNNKHGSTDILLTKGKYKHRDMELSKLESESESDASGTDISDFDEEYEAMMQNCYHLNLTMGDLEALANEMNECNSDDTDEESEHGSESRSCNNDIGQNDSAIKKSIGVNSGSEVSTPNTKRNKQKTKDPMQIGNEDSSHSGLDEQNNSRSVTTSPSLVNDHKQEKITKGEKAEANKKELGNKQVIHVKKKKGIEPDDIIASILEDEDSGNEQPKRKKEINSPVKLPAFKGLGSLLASTASADLQSSSSANSCGQPTAVKIVSNDPNLNRSVSEGKKKDKTPNDPKKKLTISNPQKTSSSDTSSNEMSSDESISDSSTPVSQAKPGISQNGTTKDQFAFKMKQQQDNQKRLTAMEERRKERELQKQTIQGALLKMDAHKSKKTHIVFNSESESESEKEEDASTSEAKIMHTDLKAKTSTAKLFDSNDEDSDNEDDERFEIKAQFEGRSGEKLMQLQSRFGIDERFKMDSRFLESSEDEDGLEDLQLSKEGDEEDDLSAEKKKNLGILQSILSINVEPQPTSKQTVKAKKFKDLNALQYDPTKEDHTVFESKTEEEKKESKSQRKKKRLEAEKLPEVSKDTYHEINVDFKEAFGATELEMTEEPETTWDQEPEKMDADVFQEQKIEEPGEFTFSFFGNSVEESTSNNEPYKTEIINPAKVAWQEDPRFQDSSSEGEDEEPDASRDTKAKTSTQPEGSSIRFFFFIKDDERLKAGPKMFFRSSNTEQRAWEQRQDILLEECRKRHKAAKRKIKGKH